MIFNKEKYNIDYIYLSLHRKFISYKEYGAPSENFYGMNIVDKINYLEANPEIKEFYKNAGKNYILENFNIEKVGKMWIDFINDLIN